jgi:hypothetical protein
VGIVYPGTPPGSVIDTFDVPSNPVGTPLSEAGDGNTRDLTQSIKDQGLAITAIEGNAALKGHDHSGDGTATSTGAKLSQANTHQNVDTDTSPTSFHHTIGVGANQAAAGNHVHDYSVITDTPYRTCLSTNRPSSPFFGMMIFETDTNFVRIWSTINTVTAWHLAPMLAVPVVRLEQTVSQNLRQGGTLIQWDSILEDNNHFTSPGSLTDIVIQDAGLYHIDAAIQWSSNQSPDTCFMVVTLNGAETTLRENRFMRGDVYIPGFSQTLSASGKYRFNAGDIVRLKVDYTVSAGLVNLIDTFIEHILGQATYSKITSHIEMSFISS